ncbi:hypothetical protein [Pseudaestuariivita rosea]|uniref:hypothetical protein n=1 Tax=Pseudaestuariivita rosea TaxID=2763263 RepID=UPI001ABB25AC|nr:hypothetical protein [Pseudaestuariivita rosea]
MLGYIQLDETELILAFLALAAVALFYLFLIAATVFFLIRKRWSLAPLPLVLFLGLAFGPPFFAERQAQTKGQMLAELSYWPQDLDLQGKTIAFLYFGYGGPCGRICDVMLAHSDVGAVYVLTSYHLQDEGGTGPVDLEGNTVWKMVPFKSNDPAYQDEVYYQMEKAPPPAAFDYLFMIDGGGFFSKRAASALRLSPDAAEIVDEAFYIYDVAQDQTPVLAENKPLARMLVTRAVTRERFFWFSKNQRTAPRTNDYNRAMQRWFCGYETDDHGDPCRYIF